MDTVILVLYPIHWHGVICKNMIRVIWIRVRDWVRDFLHMIVLAFEFKHIYFHSYIAVQNRAQLTPIFVIERWNWDGKYTVSRIVNAHELLNITKRENRQLHERIRQLEIIFEHIREKNSTLDVFLQTANEAIATIDSKTSKAKRKRQKKKSKYPSVVDEYDSKL